ncbi:hypothetical protein Q31b_28550 [Novipirellula aureliae]|uniref:Uncharacterized protein n=1 Tax=Novipirellula aureliae TaxID=2527966 RepID=A0A5C6E180_9BACT|nr:hypothetical protein [Novipirellula aureliae]TWU41411.1 hypothetical protein Q31b_28550 [Novipirellula aureliae]
MYELICPHCEAPLSVAPSQAGDQIRCSACQQSVDVPKLGVLKQLPKRESSGPENEAKISYQETGSAPRIGIATLGLIATAALLIAGYCGIRWAMIDASVSTEIHLAELRDAYETAKPAELIREFEQMQEKSLELPQPYNYKVIENRKRAWGRNGAVAGSVALIAAIGAFFLGNSGRSKPKNAEETLG